MSYSAEFIKKLYLDRDKIIIGLTGRTGSGCSTAADILRQDTFSSISMSDVNQLSGNHKRKALVIHKHAKATWRGFYVITVSNVIIYMTLKALKENPNSSLSEKTEKLLIELKSKIQDIEKQSITYEFAQKNAECILSQTENKSDYKMALQELGDNIRSSGDPLTNSENPENCFSLQEEISEIIRNNDDKYSYFAIDAIRNPYEAQYFKQRFSYFHLVAITIDDDTRRRRLSKIGYNNFDINKIDYKEGMDLKDIDLDDTDKERVTSSIPKVGELYSQNISLCLESSDIFISNSTEEIKTTNNPRSLADQLVKFISLIKRPGLVTPTAIERCMQVAFMSKYNSGCLSRQVGAVVTTNKFSIISVGWNDVAHGQVPCNLRNAELYINNHDNPAFSEFELGNEKFSVHIKSLFKQKISAFRNNHFSKSLTISYCFKDEYNAITRKSNQVFTRALHAEENAFLQISKRGGTPVEGGYLFTTASPCELCAKKAYQLGIVKIFYVDPYPGISQDLFLKAGNVRPELLLFSGAIGRSYDQLYRPLMPMKDEISKLTNSNGN